MSPWWLLLIIPGVFSFGYFFACLMFIAKEKNEIMKYYLNKLF